MDDDELLYAATAIAHANPDDEISEMFLAASCAIEPNAEKRLRLAAKLILKYLD